MSNVAPLVDRNQAFAATDARQNVPALPFIPFLNLYIVTCIDCRVDPAEILGIKLGEALVERNIGGRVTPAVIRDIAYAGYLVESKAPEGPWFEVAIIHHTDCGSTLLADDELRHGFAQRIGVDERTLDRYARPGPGAHGPHRRRPGAMGAGDPVRRPGLRARLRRQNRRGHHRCRREVAEVTAGRRRTAPAEGKCAARHGRKMRQFPAGR